jgi:hypothetical protein
VSGRPNDDRHVFRSLGDVLIASPLFVSAPLYRQWHLRWGATDAEVAAAMPGDELLPDTSFNATRAITIDAPPAAVWRWLVQIGRGRAGWYSYDFFDNASHPSAAHILPEFQHPRIGDWVPMAATINEATAFKIRDLKAHEWLVWEKPDSTWSWKLIPLTGGGTRLVSRLKARYAWRESTGSALLSLVLLELADFPMMRRLLLNLRCRAEATAVADLLAAEDAASRG